MVTNFIGKIQANAPAPEPEIGERELLKQIRDLLWASIRTAGGSRNWTQDYIDLVANVPVRIPERAGRKSLSVSVSPQTGSTGDVYFGAYPHVSTLTGMPILNGGEREFQHEAEMWFVADAATRLIYSEEWEV